MRKTFPVLWVILLIFFGWESGSWSAPLKHDFISTENAEITGQPVQSTLRLPRACARGMLRVDPEPFEGLTAPREIEGRLFLPRSCEQGSNAVEGSRKT